MTSREHQLDGARHAAQYRFLRGCRVVQRDGALYAVPIVVIAGAHQGDREKARRVRQMARAS